MEVFMNFIVTGLFLIVLGIIVLGSNLIEASSIDFKYVSQNIFRCILTGLIGFWVAEIFKYGKKIEEKASVNILRKIQRKDGKWIFNKIENFRNSGADLYHLEYPNEDKVDEIELFLKRNKFTLYFCDGSKSEMKSEGMKINETRIEVNNTIRNKIEVEYFDGNGNWYSKIFIQQ
jgi:hypothetical protein